MNETVAAMIAAVAGGAGIFGLVQAVTHVSARARANAAIASLIAARKATASAEGRRTVQDAIDREALVLASIYLFPARFGAGTMTLISAAWFVGLLTPFLIPEYRESMRSGIFWPTYFLSAALGFVGVVTVIILRFAFAAIDRDAFLRKKLKKISPFSYTPPVDLEETPAD